MKKGKGLYLGLFLSTLQLSACTFGGGFVIIPLMRKKFVEDLHWIGEQEMMDLTAIAQSSPGAIAVNASILVGYRVAGVAGALTTVLGTVLPPLVILSAVSFFYAALRDNWIVSLVMKGMQAGVAAVLCDVVYTMGKPVFAAKKPLAIIILAASFAAVAFLKIHVVLIILACGILGAVDTYFQEKARKERT